MQTNTFDSSYHFRNTETDHETTASKPLKEETIKTKKTQQEVFHTVKTRIAEDKINQKLKLKGSRLFNDKIEKEELNDDKKENRSLNVTSKLKSLEAGLKEVFKTEKFDPHLSKLYIKKILGEYKSKLKEANGEVHDAVSFATYITNKYLPEIHADDQRITIDLFKKLQPQGFFREIDNQLVARYSGAEKAVYCFDNMAVLTAKKQKHEQVLEDEYKMTVDIRVNEMKRVLTEKKAYFLEKTKIPLTDEKIDQVISAYRHALEDLSNDDVEDARSFFIMRSFYTLSEPESVNFELADGSLVVAEIAREIDANLMAIDLTRKKFVENGSTYYRGLKATCDLKAFLSNKGAGKPSIDNLSLEQLTVFLKSFDAIKEAMSKAQLLHGDIKPDNILVYEEKTAEGHLFYTVKISDFGKSKLGAVSQLHTGNPRFHKGLYDTFQTQQTSLNMIKLLVLNSNVRVAEDAVDQEKLAIREAHQNLVLKKNKKISDIAFTQFGHSLYAQGLVKMNYFSNVNGDVFSRAYSSVRFSSDNTLKELSANTVDAALKFLKTSSETDTRHKQLDVAEKNLVRRIETFNTLLEMHPSEENREKMIKDKAHDEVLLTQIRNQKLQSEARG